MTTPNRRRALPATEWQRIRKDTTTSAALATGGKLSPAAGSGVMDPDKGKAPLPPIEGGKVEEISLPRKAGCVCDDVRKCGCQVVQKPMSAPADGESKDDFMSRCMGDEVMRGEFPDDARRAAVCNRQWAEKATPTAKAEVSMQTSDLPPDKTVDEPEQEHKGVMLALWVPGGVAKSLAIEGGNNPDDMHMTLGYFGKLGRDISHEQADAMFKCVSMAAKRARPFKGAISGMGRFAGTNTSDGKDVLYASVDLPGLAKFRTELMDEMQKCSGVVKSELHDFTPHITLKHINEDEPSPVQKIARQEVTFSHIVLAVGNDRKMVSLGEMEQTFKRWVPICKVEGERRRVTGIVLQPEVVDAQRDIISAEAIEDAAHAFLANYNTKTKLGLQHSVAPGSPVSQFPKGLHLVESYVAPVDMVLNGRPIKKGAWLMTVFVEDDDVWARVKSGAIRGFSIGGIAKVQRLTA